MSNFMCHGIDQVLIHPADTAHLLDADNYAVSVFPAERRFRTYV